MCGWQWKKDKIEKIIINEKIHDNEDNILDADISIKDLECTLIFFIVKR